MLTDALELHFLDMVKFRKEPEKDIEKDALQRWLVYFDKHSPVKLIEEVLRMDPAIREMEGKIEWIQGNPELFRSYLRYEKAVSDEITRINGARREGSTNKAIEIAKNALTEGVAPEFVSKITGLDIDTIKRLKAGY
jgi:predicted transposase/invertase (TIGR01784 family)